MNADSWHITPTYAPFKTVIWHNEAALLCSIDFKFSWIKNHWVAFHKLVNQNGAKSVSGTFFIKKFIFSNNVDFSRWFYLCGYSTIFWVCM